LEDGINATVVDLRYKMNEILRALERRESVTILYHGKVKGTILPASGEPGADLSSHPFFGSTKKKHRQVSEIMAELRGGRYRAL
jgi:hypothetical protein